MNIPIYCAKDQSQLLQHQWPVEAFNNSGSTLICHKESNDPKVILKNLDRWKKEEELQELIFMLTGVRNKVHRFRYRDTGKPLPVVKVTFQSRRGIQALLERKLVIEGVEAISEEYRYRHSREIRCYKCHQKDHIARICENESLSR